MTIKKRQHSETYASMSDVYVCCEIVGIGFRKQSIQNEDVMAKTP